MGRYASSQHLQSASSSTYDFIAHITWAHTSTSSASAPQIHSSTLQFSGLFVAQLSHIRLSIRPPVSGNTAVKVIVTHLHKSRWRWGFRKFWRHSLLRNALFGNRDLSTKSLDILPVGFLVCNLDMAKARMIYRQETTRMWWMKNYQQKISTRRMTKLFTTYYITDHLTIFK